MESKHLILAVAVIVAGIVVYKCMRKNPISEMARGAQRVLKKMVKGVNDQNGYYPVPMQCVDLVESAEFQGKSQSEKTAAYDSCIRSDCQLQCQTDCVSMGVCTCAEQDEYGNCLSITPPTEDVAVVDKCTDKCYTDYTTEFQPLEVAIKKIRARAKLTKRRFA